VSASTVNERQAKKKEGKRHKGLEHSEHWRRCRRWISPVTGGEGIEEERRLVQLAVDTEGEIGIHTEQGQKKSDFAGMDRVRRHSIAQPEGVPRPEGPATDLASGLSDGSSALMWYLSQFSRVRDLPLHFLAVVHVLLIYM
jgi:hypothetical protein